MNNKKRYYIIGIAGVAMASLAGLLKKKGYEVAGSDQEMYEPMKSMLEKLKIKIFSPYSAFHMKHWKPDVVVVGNAIGGVIPN
ncbi:MAG: UDP-N-acetylmuramate:L-alanyl-gamma-D-glutamyl-meso-diaminopimelate ligase [Candidatus Giovannonibacteria bacterium GW2011_GWC2_43_8]|nr:MAG: UDP-N-acetylmuramate:L-alanyl-gamma-D-glutamyl-meso-diaminopimelate ligase [Candidatus Giovannonibacteria bacterium GW2011_GWC2_43_8]